MVHTQLETTSNSVHTYIVPFNIYRMIKGALQSKKTNIYNR